MMKMESQDTANDFWGELSPVGLVFHRRGKSDWD
jgi:hypothetical protein